MKNNLNIYVQWVGLFVGGFLNEADSIMGQHRKSILSVARKLDSIKKLYRGILIPPGPAGEAMTVKDLENAEAVSFTEDLEIACFFAAPDSYMAGVVKMQRPNVVGYVGEIEAKPKDIVFSYRWYPAMKKLTQKHFKADPERIIAASFIQNFGPQSLGVVSQFVHNLKVQKEVILVPQGELEFRPSTDYKCADGKTLARKFIPPGFLPTP